MCPPQSPLAQSQRSSTPANRKPQLTLPDNTSSFITSHSASMDPCNNPSYQTLHGLLSTRNPLSGILLPIFSISKTTAHADMLSTPYENWMSGDLTHVNWEDKRDDRAMWRGSVTGGHWSEASPWRDSQRMRLVKLGEENNRDMFDFAFTGSPLRK
jgi:hypothetical protein